mgnify:FL=1
MKKILSWLLVLALALTLTACNNKNTASDLSDTKHLVCNNCDAEISADDKFCGECGSSINSATAVCSNCGEEIDATKKFCSKCGASTESEEDATSEPTNIYIPDTSSKPSTSNPSQPTSSKNETTCRKTGCKNVVGSSGQYCYDHKCSRGGCSSAKSVNCISYSPNNDL